MRVVVALWLLFYSVYGGVVATSALGLRPLGSPWFAGALWGLSAALAARVALTVRVAPGAAAAGRLEAPERVLAGAAALALAAVAALAWLTPVGAYDAIGYRLPAAAQWLDAGAVAWVPGDDNLRNGYPLALEVLEASLVALTGSTRGITLLGVAFVGLGAAVVYAAPAALGFARGPRLLAASLFALVPMHLLNAPSGYADAPFAAALVGTLVLGAVHAAGAELAGAPLLLGVCAGFTIALKPPGFAYAGLVLAAAALVRARAVGVRAAARELVLPVLVASPGLFFLARNVLVAHNPLYPLEVRLFGQLIFPGEGSLDGILTPDANVPKVLRSLPRVLRTPTVWLQVFGPAQAFDDRLAGLGYAFPGAALPALAWALYTGLRREARAGALAAPRRALLFVAGLSAALFVVQPFSFWPRFTSWLWGAGALGLGLAYQAAGTARRGRTAVALLALVVTVEAAASLRHVQYAAVLGGALWEDDPAQRLADASGVSADFVRRHLAGRADVCRTGWTDGTDDANLDGIVAQLVPRPHMHVVMEADWPAARARTAGFGCDALIAIGQSPLRGMVPADVQSIPARAFGFVDVLRPSAP